MQTVDREIGTWHPLDPLSAEEVETAARVLREQRGLGEETRFVYIGLDEPPKVAVLGLEPAAVPDRRARLLLRDRSRRRTFEAVVSLTHETVVEWRELVGVQPPIMFEEFEAAERAVKADPGWREAMRRRGVTEEELELAILDPWSLGYNGPDDAPERGRFVRALTWLRPGPGQHCYARPVEGLVVRVDLDRMAVAEIEDHGVVPLPAYTANYRADQIADPNNFPRFPDGVRRDVRPLEISQPQGPSFELEGRQVRWQKWRLRVGFTPREGLVLHQVGYQDGDRLRPILYRASISEMFIPYGDPNPTHYRKNVFDMGEYGLGLMTNSLELGCDCLGEIRYLDAVVNDGDGNAVRIPNAICIHEEDYGILWKHTDFRTGEVEVRRSRRLVVSSIATVGNYDYGFFWYFYQDGTIGYEVKLTGVISNGAVPDGVRPRHGVLVAPNVYGPNHQHFFCMRLDMMVDGLHNTVLQCDSEAVPPGPDNPHGNAWVVSERPLRRESEAASVVNPLSARTWKIVNPERRNALGDPVAYRLVPGENVLPFYQPEAHAIRRAGFATRHLWVTAYDPAERYAAGDFPNQHPGGDGLPRYVEADRPIENADVVVWYVFGAHHVPRPEDWPVMPVAFIGFQLRPQGFFDGNPALDVPPQHPHAG
jgi:primary-amine oxidase